MAEDESLTGAKKLKKEKAFYSEEEKKIGPGTKIFLLLAAVGFIFIAYMIFFGSDPRNQLETPEETLAAYTNFSQGFVGNTQARPNDNDVKTFLEFFDGESRSFFEQNYEAIAALQFPVNPKNVNNLSDGRKRSEAVLQLISRPPLGGIGRVTQQRTLEDGALEITAISFGGGEATFAMEESMSNWYIRDFAGNLEELQQDVEAIRERLSE